MARKRECDAAWCCSHSNRTGNENGEKPQPAWRSRRVHSEWKRTYICDIIVSRRRVKETQTTIYTAAADSDSLSLSESRSVLCRLSRHSCRRTEYYCQRLRLCACHVVFVCLSVCLADHLLAAPVYASARVFPPPDITLLSRSLSLSLSLSLPAPIPLTHPLSLAYRCTYHPLPNVALFPTTYSSTRRSSHPVFTINYIILIVSLATWRSCFWECACAPIDASAHPLHYTLFPSPPYNCLITSSFSSPSSIKFFFSL